MSPPELGFGHAAPEVHHASRRCGGVAVRGARAAAGKTADHRVLGRGHAFGRGAMDRRLCASGCANSAGSRAAPSRSSIAGRRGAASATPKSRPSSFGSRSMSSSRRHCAVLAAKQATSAIPIVFARSGDPVERRPVVVSLARPGGNVTGLSLQQTDTGRQAARTLARGGPRSPPVGDHGECRRCPGAVIETREIAGSGARPQPRMSILLGNPARGGYRARH